MRLSNWCKTAFTAASLACFAGTSPAQAEGVGTIPSGIFAYPSCESAETVWVLAAGTELYASEGQIIFAVLAPVKDVLEEGWIDIGDGIYMRSLPDGNIEDLYWDGEEDAPSRNEILSILPKQNTSPDPTIWGTSRYVPCSQMSLPYSLMYGESANFLLALDPVIEACTADMTQCGPKLFGLFDRHEDGVLSIAELSRMMRVLITLGVALDNNADHEMTGASLLASLAVAPLAANAIMASYDYDASGGLAYEEVASELVGVLPSPAEEDLDMQGRAQELLEAAREGAGELVPLLRGLAQ